MACPIKDSKDLARRRCGIEVSLDEIGLALVHRTLKSTKLDLRTATGVVDAAASGFDLNLFPLESQDEAILRENRPEQLNIMDMDATDPIADQIRAPRVRDPYVVVPRYMDHVPPLLSTYEFRQGLEQRFPIQQWVSIIDATQYYLAVREFVYDTINMS
jgi:hypothetical protein